MRSQRRRKVCACGKARSYVTVVYSWSPKTTARNFNRSRKGLGSIGAVLQDVEIDGEQFHEWYAVESNGRTLQDVRCILRSYGLSQVYYGRSGRVLNANGKGKVWHPSGKEAERVYQANKKPIEARLYAIGQQMRTEARDAIASAQGPLSPAVYAASRINTPKGNYLANYFLARLQRISRLRNKLVALWNAERIHDSNADVVNAVLARLANDAKHILETIRGMP